MKATKSALPIATWLVLIFFVALLFIGNLSCLKSPEWKSVEFYLSVALVICPLLLLVGKAMSKQPLVVISSLLIGIALFIRLIFNFGDILSPHTLLNFLLISIALLFMSKGN